MGNGSGPCRARLGPLPGPQTCEVQVNFKVDFARAFAPAPARHVVMLIEVAEREAMAAMRAVELAGVAATSTSAAHSAEQSGRRAENLSRTLAQSHPQ